MAKEAVYGFPCVEDPHDFTPDADCCTPEEIAFWEESKRRWDAGERDVRGKRCESQFDAEGRLVRHTAQSSWGVGVNMVDMEED